MDRLLVAISIGPVQPFIAAARRTRDFWMGSIVLSECARAVARCVADAPECGLPALIFPAPEELRELDPIGFTDDQAGIAQGLDVANVVLFTTPRNGTVAPPIVGIAQRAVENTWRDFVMRAVASCRDEIRPEVLASIDDGTLFRRDRVMDFFAAWAPLADGTYAETRQLVMRLLAGRKNCRNFEQWNGVAGLPKSSLDGGRETVLIEARAGGRHGMRVRSGEELDLIGVVKRADWGHNAIRYPSVSRVAVDPFIRGLVSAPDTSSTLASLRACCLDLAEMGILPERRAFNTGATENSLSKFPWLKPFPFEGTPLYVSRHRELESELLDERTAVSAPHRLPAADPKEILATIAGLMRELDKRRGQPSPYFALLAADGDRMGETLAALAGSDRGQDRHRRFSRRQAEFAAQAREAINTIGACVYASADDVLAFLPVDRAVACAERLQRLFAESDLVDDDARAQGVLPPTLSVGIVIGHFMEPLEDLLGFVRRAEERAKTVTDHERRSGQQRRNGLAVAVHARGGAPFTVRDNWSRKGIVPFASRIHGWTLVACEDRVSSKAGYDLRMLAREYAGWSTESEDDRRKLGRAIRADALRVLSRKRGAIGPMAQKLAALVRHVNDARDLETAANELVLGQWLAEATLQAGAVGDLKQIIGSDGLAGIDA